MSNLLHDVFSQTVHIHPGKIAVYQEGGISISYQQLDALSNQFATYIRRLKPAIRYQPFVGILSSVHIQSIAAALGILKAGGAYLPLDEHSPAERLLKIVSNAQLDTVVLDPFYYEKYQSLFQATCIKHILLLEQADISTTVKTHLYEHVTKQPAQELPNFGLIADDIAYILHSSGSTGIPKGIILTHRNARTFVDWMHKEFQLTPDDVVMSRAPFKFDLSVFDIFNTFRAGATLVCFDWKKERTGTEAKHRDYIRLMEEQKATILYTTPSTFITLMRHGGLVEAKLQLREIMYAGEPFPVLSLRELQEILPHTRMANIYGPTETNIITCQWIDTLPSDNSPIPLGKEVDDTEILIVSEDGGTQHICAANELGEIWCRGGTVTLGYLGMPEETRLHLVDSPFHVFPAKFWRTGDYGFRDEAGILHYRGRRDHMVKVKSFRVELGEIEAALAQYSYLDEFAVIAVPDEKYTNRLYCFYSRKLEACEIDLNLPRFLASRIPEYMIPYQFIEKQSLPKTSSEKIDRISLTNEIVQMQVGVLV